MTRSFTRRLPGMLFVAVALLAALAAPVATCAAQPGPSEAPSEPAASQPAPTTAPGDPGDGQGEVVIDGPFVTPTPEASILDAGSEPRLTPPPTDVVPRTGPPPVDGTTRLLLLSGAGCPGARHRDGTGDQSSSCVPGQTNDTGPSYSALTEATVSSGSKPIWMCVSSTRATPVDAARRPDGRSVEVEHIGWHRPGTEGHLRQQRVARFDQRAQVVGASAVAGVDEPG